MKKLLACSIVLFSACTIIGTDSWFEKHEKDVLAQQAAFDLDCKKEEVQFTRLGDNARTQGATCKDKKATYTYVKTGPGSINSSAWARN